MNLKILALAAAAALAAGTAQAASVDVHIHGAASAKGRVMVSLCTKDEFLKSCALKAAAPASRGDVSVSFANVAAGDYAVMAFHDENADGQLNRNPLGIPMEGVGFSRDAVMNQGPPSFNDAVVKIGPAKASLDFTLTYY